MFSHISFSQLNSIPQTDPGREKTCLNLSAKTGSPDVNPGSLAGPSGDLRQDTSSLWFILDHTQIWPQLWHSVSSC